MSKEAEIAAIGKAAEAFTDYEQSQGRRGQVNLAAIERACKAYATEVRQHEAEKPQVSEQPVGLLRPIPIGKYSGQHPHYPHRRIVGYLYDDSWPEMHELVDDPLRITPESLVLHQDILEMGARHERESGWQPISTAPRDRKILAFAFDRFDSRKAEMHTTFWNNGRWAWFSSHYQPTHWMPLPEPPK